jgi:hypothetical protein
VVLKGKDFKTKYNMVILKDKDFKAEKYGSIEREGIRAGTNTAS